jgi:hypothetical protein
MTRLFVLVLCAMLASATASRAQSTDGRAVLTVQRSLSVATVRSMRLEAIENRGSLAVSGTSVADAPAMIQISGDPGRVYRIRLPQALGADDASIIENLSIVSATSGDISSTRVAHMDLEGRDMLRISGRLRIRIGDQIQAVAALPLSIDYE